MAIKCPKCNADNPDTVKFCGECGTQLTPSGSIPDVTKTLETPAKGLALGSTFAGRYQIMEELGRGGMGAVYKALDIRINEEVAIKLLRPEIAADEKTLERFSNELKLARKISHKHVCRMYDIGREDEKYFITMEYVAGEDLKSLIRGKDRIPESEVLRIAQQICEGLVGAHELGIVHRDLKPQNIMIDKKGNAKIMDFGIARSVEAPGVTATGVIIGTPDYISPEQAEGQEADHRSDIYSLGVILYEMITGTVPFKGDTALSVALKHKSQLPLDLRKLNPEVSDEMSRLILICMEKERERRYQTTEALLADLRNIEDDLPLGTKISPRRETLIAVLVRKKLFIPSLIAALAIMAAIVWQFLPKKEAIPVILDKPSVAVLPFLDLSSQKDQDYFCIGMTDEIIARLSTFKEWKVIPRTSMMRFKDTTKDIKEIGHELDVTAILEGSVRKEKENLRIIATLINVSDSSQLWSNTYEEKLESVFAIQTNIAETIAEALKVELSPEEKEQLSKSPTESLNAYDYYLKAREYYGYLRKQDNENAIELLTKALELDPKFALAYSGLGDSYAQRVLKFGFPTKWLDESIKASHKAILLDPNLSEGYKALGIAYFTKGWFQKAIEANQTAVELNPNNEQAIQNLGWCYYRRGEFVKAILRFEKQNTLISPMDPNYYDPFACVYSDLGDYYKAELFFGKVLELQSDYFDANFELIYCYLTQGQYQKAIDHSQKFLLMYPDNPITLELAGRAELYACNYDSAQNYYQKSINFRKDIYNSAYLGYIYWKMGRKTEAQDLFKLCFVLCQEELESGNEWWHLPYTLAAINAIQGHKDQAYEWLGKAIERGWREFQWGMIDPRFENLHEDVQFKQMTAQVKGMVEEMRKRIEEMSS